MISGGGTGGHVYPALVVARHLREEVTPPPAILYVGSREGVEGGIVAREGLPFWAVSTGPLRVSNPLKAARSLVRMGRGVREARRLVREFRPHVVLVTGGYVPVPVALAAWLEKVPLLVYLPDLEPGLAVRFLARLASRIAVSFPEATRYFPPAKTVVTGYPVRKELFTVGKAEARRRLGLDEEEKTLLVFGGSRGAHSINVALARALPSLLDLCQVVHIAGVRDEPWLQREREHLPACLQGRYRLYSYLYEEMPLALVAADLVVARAGAATLGEFPAAGVPAILVPYPYAGRHQERNADYLVRHGAAVKLDDARLREELLPTVVGLLKDEKALAQMAGRARSLARPQAAANIAREVRALGGESSVSQRGML